MYEELITQLRADEIPLDELIRIMREAADAIEKLSKELTELKLLTCCCGEPPKEET